MASGSLTAVGAGTHLTIARGKALRVQLSGTFVGTIVLQKAAGDPAKGAWKNLQSFTSTADSTYDFEDGSYRLYCSAYTSGSADYELTQDYDTAISEDDLVNLAKLGLYDLELIPSALQQDSRVPTRDPGIGSTFIASCDYADAAAAAAVAALVDSAPSVLDTLNEIAAAMGDDPNFAVTVMNLLSQKLDSSDAAMIYAPLDGDGATGQWDIDITGNAATVTNGLYSTGSYSDPAWLTDLAGSKISGDISGNAGSVTNGVYTSAEYANPDWITELAYGKISGAPTNVSAFTNDSGYLVSSALLPYLTSATAASTYQPIDGTLTALANLTITANTLTIGTAGDTFLQTSFAANTFPARSSSGNLVAKTITDFGLSLIDDTDATAMISTLGLAALYQPLDSDLTAIAALTTTSFGRGLLAEASASSLKGTLSLGLVDNTADASKPVSALQAAADATVLASAQSYADGLVVGLWDDRGGFDASGGAYPSSGGSGSAGAILKGDVWTISVAGTLPTAQVVEVGDLVRATINTPGNTQANWAITQNNIGYTAENTSNKTDTMAGNTSSSTKYLSSKGVYDYALATYQPLDATLTAMAALTIAANSLSIGSGADAFTQTTFSANTFPARASSGNLAAKTITDFGLSLIDDADATAAVATLGLSALYQPLDSDLTAIAALSTTSFGRGILAEASAASLKSTLSIALDDLSDVIIASAAVDDILKYNGVSWVNGQATTVNGGAGVNFYYDDTVSDVSTYQVLNRAPQNVVESSVTGVANNNSVLIKAYASPVAGLGGTQIDAGEWNFDVYAKVGVVGVGTTTVDVKVYSRTSGGTETLLFTVSSAALTVTQELYSLSTIQQAFSISSTDRLVVKVYATTTSVVNRTVTFYYGGTTHYSNFSTPLVSRHNDLAGLQGGTTGQYYHMTAAQIAALTTYVTYTGATADVDLGAHNFLTTGVYQHGVAVAEATGLDIRSLGSPVTLGYSALGLLTGNTNAAVDFEIRNLSAGASATSDITAVGDNSSNYMGIGIVSSAYALAGNEIYAANAAYLYSQTGNVNIGTFAAKDIIFHSGGGALLNEVGRFKSDGSFAIGHSVARQQLVYILTGTTTNATNTELFIDGGSTRLVLPNNTAWLIDAEVGGFRTDAAGEAAMYKYWGCIRRGANAAATAIPSGITKYVAAEDTAAWNSTMSADTTNGSLKIDVDGQGSKTIHWVATVRLTQIQ